MRPLHILAALLSIAAMAALTPAQKGRPMTVHDLHALRRLQSFSVSTQGNVVYDVRFWDESTATKTTHLEVLQLSSGSAKVLTQKDGANDFSPVFVNDSSVAFLSTRSGSSQIWMVPTTGNEQSIYQLTNYPIDIDTFKWSNAGYFVFSASVYIDCPDFQCTADRDAAKSAKTHTTGVVYDELFVRHWDVWETPGKVSHLFVQKVSFNSASGTWSLQGNPIDLMSRMSANTPVPPTGGAEQYDISPDGSEIAFTTALVNHESAWTTGWITYTVSFNAASSAVGTPVIISGFTQARTQNPVYSPDGTRIAFLSMDRPGFEADRLHIVVYDRTSRYVSTVANNWDRSVGGLIWTADGSGFFVDADDDGRHKVFRIDGMTGTVTELTAAGDSMNLVLVPGAPTKILLLKNSYTAPSDLWMLSTDTLAMQQLTNLNKGLLSQLSLSVPTSIYFKSDGNVTIQAWLFAPFGFSQSMNRAWPLAHVIHGGPQGAWTDAWSYRWNPQLWASRGYFVLMPNPRGSSGFGQAYEDAVSGDWGGVPFHDIMNSLSYTLSNNPWIDAQRVCACGASYGGFMMNWLNGHTTNYKCLVNHDGVFDSTAMYYSTEEIWFMEWEYKGTPTSNPDLYRKFSPATYVSNWQTPTLVVHGGMDFRIPITEGISTFTALQRKGVPSKMLYFPDENHWVLKPQNGIKWYDTVLAWLDQWTQNTPPRV